MARIRKESDDKRHHKKNIWNIALYIRLSRDDGNDESLSVINQKKILNEYVEKNFQDAYLVMDTYVDDGRTGTDYDRPEFQRMLLDVEGKKVNCVICKNLARAFRNYSDQGYFLESYFPQHSVRFITLGDPKVDTYLNPEAISGMEVPINGLMNDRFAYATSSSVRRTFDNKRRNGEFIGAFAPYGYRKDPADKNVLIIDEAAAQVVKDIFHWFVYGDGSSGEGLSKEGIARKLNGLGIPNPTLYKKRNGLPYQNPRANENDGLWIGASISRLLRNKVYIGTMVQGRQRIVSYKVHDTVNLPEDEWFQVAHTHEPIVSVELFTLAEKLHARDTRAAPGRKEKHLFSGFLKCADCGKSMTRRASGTFVYYNCSTYRRKSKDICTKHTMRLDILEASLLLILRKQIELTEELDETIQNIVHAPASQSKANRYQKLLTLRTQELDKIQNLISGLYIDWKGGEISHEQYRNLKERLEGQEEKLKESIHTIKKEMGGKSSEASPGNPYLDAFLTYKNIHALSQGIITELLETIDIHEGGRITIHFTFSDPYKQTADHP